MDTSKDIKRYFRENRQAAYVMLLFIILILGVFYWMGKNEASDKAISTPIFTNQTDDEHQIAEGELVRNFPYFPVYPGAQVEGSKMEVTVGDYEGHWVTDDATPAEIMDWYMGTFEQEGDWEVVDAPPEEEMLEMFGVFGREDKLYYLTIEGYSDTDEVEIQVEVIPRSLRGDQ